MPPKREVELVIISDIHLGTYGCHAKELLNYLKSIHPKTLILNGDIIDIWSFRKSYFPKAHIDVIRCVLKMLSRGTEVIYITGNHDDALRKYVDLNFGNLQLTNHYLMELDNKKAWIFHGDVFDNTTKGSAKLIAKLGGKGYDLLILINRAINWILVKMNRDKLSFSKSVKNSVKKAVSWISNFESTAAELAIEKKVDFVICGHIHKQQIKTIVRPQGSVIYLNSGDWVENLTALEYNQKEWTIYQYNDEDLIDNIEDEEELNFETQIFAPFIN